MRESTVVSSQDVFMYYFCECVRVRCVSDGGDCDCYLQRYALYLYSHSTGTVAGSSDSAAGSSGSAAGSGCGGSSSGGGGGGASSV